MTTYKQIKEDNGFGWVYITKYVCREDPRLEIRIVRGALRHDRPTGYNIYFAGEFTGLWDLTLTGAKEYAEDYLKTL